MKGKNKCKILKEIRQRIADENDIPYVTRECTYQGDCAGTCPKCEAELRYLEQELEKRRRLGKSVAVAALAAGLSLSLSACVPGGGSGSGGTSAPTLPTVNPPISSTYPELEGEPTETIAGMIDTMPPETMELAGDINAPPETEEPLMGKFPAPTETELLMGEEVPPETGEPLAGVPEELEGDVAYLPPEIEAEGAEAAAPADETR